MPRNQIIHNHSGVTSSKVTASLSVPSLTVESYMKYYRVLGEYHVDVVFGNHLISASGASNITAAYRLEPPMVHLYFRDFSVIPEGYVYLSVAYNESLYGEGFAGEYEGLSQDAGPESVLISLLTNGVYPLRMKEWCPLDH